MADMERTYRFLQLVAVLGFCVAGFHNSTSAQNQAVLGALKDNTLYQSATGAVSNGAGEAFFVGRTAQPSESIRRGLLAFPIAENIPQGSTVLSVTLTLHMSRTSLSEPTTPVGLHRVLGDWGEGTSNANGNEGTGATATTNDATWIHRFFDASPWTSPGSDFSTQSSASVSVTGVGFYTWESTTSLVGDVQNWVDNPGANFGWVLIGNEGSAATSKRFDSKENIDTTVRPQLTVSYLPVLADVEQGASLPHSPALQQNYPNPFNPSTTIGYTVTGLGSGWVRLSVHDLLGREVAVLVNERKEPGSHSVNWNASGMASGVYLYNLTAGSFVQTRKMVYTR